MTGRTYRRVARILATLAFVALGAVVALRPAPLWAHGNPEVSVDPNPADAGAEVTIEGTGFEEETEISLVLEGVLGETVLGTVVTDAEGAFSLTVTIPTSIAPGSYRVRAVGEDEVAVADVRIEAAATGAETPPEHEASISFHRIDAPAEVAGFAVLAAVALVVGALLIWFPRETRHA